MTKIVLIGGGLCSGSSNAADLRTAEALGLPGLQATLFDGLGALPHFNLDEDHGPLLPPVVHLRCSLSRVNAVSFSTPEYAGSLPGVCKNLLDWTVGFALHQKPVGWINPSSHGGSEGAYATPRPVLGFIGAPIIEDACVKYAVRRDMIDVAGVTEDYDLRAALMRVRRLGARCLGARRPARDPLDERWLKAKIK